MRCFSRHQYRWVATPWRSCRLPSLFQVSNLKIAVTKYAYLFIKQHSACRQVAKCLAVGVTAHVITNTDSANFIACFFSKMSRLSAWNGCFISLM
jgi:hypothetical protein